MSQLLLSRRVFEHGVDLEGMARTILADELHARGAHLDASHADDALAHLIETLWVLAQRYDPSHEISFGTYCYRIGRLRVTDFWRQMLGDSRYSGRAQRVEPLRADAGDGSGGFEEAVASLDVRRLCPGGRRTLARVALPMAVEGLTVAELAERFGIPKREISSRLAELREELAGLGLGPVV
jgi:DNA-directed RNA polymerase specialized sigma24 family protein